MRASDVGSRDCGFHPCFKNLIPPNSSKMHRFCSYWKKRATTCCALAQVQGVEKRSPIHVLYGKFSIYRSLIGEVFRIDSGSRCSVVLLRRAVEEEEIHCPPTLWTGHCISPRNCVSVDQTLVGRSGANQSAFNG